eukprot:TRINITY_DN1427_c0_g1_i2.p1 TRINITY_DN1427_c0_g1~~TRINITY_DN1427_c0_g1_i2.p1  ORF type:complete len:229 (-),score=43.16 TRINITY_DN1427_c0_g1_i2:27-713(-)
MRDRLTGRSRGFGFVTFKEEDSADRAVEDTHQIQGRRVEAKKAIPKGEMSLKSKRIFVGGIPINTSDAQFRKYFEKFGTVTDAQIMKDRRSGRPRGFGFVTFQTESSVEKVLKIDHEINGKFVEVKQAQPKRPHSFGYLNQFVYPTLYPSYFPPYSVEGVHYSFSPGFVPFVQGYGMPGHYLDSSNVVQFFDHLGYYGSFVQSEMLQSGDGEERADEADDEFSYEVNV